MADNAGKNTSPAGVGRSAVAALTTVTQAVIGRDSAPSERFLVLCCFGVILIALIALCFPPYESMKQITLGVICVVAILAMFFPRLRSGTGPTEAENGPPQLSYLMVTNINDALEDATQLVYEQLQAIRSELSDDQVRSNIFFPDRDDNRNLKIYPGLHAKINGSELKIRLGPRQGVTGMVYDEGQPRVAQRLPESDGGGWDAEFHITPQLARIIHPDLKWIISMPLKAGRGKPIGVMSIDGLVHQFPVDDLYDCARSLTTPAMVIYGLATN